MVGGEQATDRSSSRFSSLAHSHDLLECLRRRLPHRPRLSASLLATSSAAFHADLSPNKCVEADAVVGLGWCESHAHTNASPGAGYSDAHIYSATLGDGLATTCTPADPPVDGRPSRASVDGAPSPSRPSALPRHHPLDSILTALVKFSLVQRSPLYRPSNTLLSLILEVEGFTGAFISPPDSTKSRGCYAEACVELQSPCRVSCVLAASGECLFHSPHSWGRHAALVNKRTEFRHRRHCYYPGPEWEGRVLPQPWSSTRRKALRTWTCILVPPTRDVPTPPANLSVVAPPNHCHVETTVVQVVCS